MRKRHPQKLATDYTRTNRKGLIYSSLTGKMEHEIVTEVQQFTSKQTYQREWYRKKKEAGVHYDGWKGGTRQDNAGNKKGPRKNGVVAKSLEIGKSANYFTDMRKNYPDRFKRILELGDGDIVAGYYALQKVYQDTARKLNKVAKELRLKDIPLRKFAQFLGTREQSLYKIINAQTITHERTYRNALRILNDYQEFIKEIG